MAAGNGPAQWSTLADEVLLADELGQRARPHPGGERLPLGWRLEERFGTGPGRAGRGAPGGHEPMVALAARRAASAQSSARDYPSVITWATSIRT